MAYALMSSALCPNGFRPRWRWKYSLTNIQSNGALKPTNTGSLPAGVTRSTHAAKSAIASAGWRPVRRSSSMDRPLTASAVGSTSSLDGCSST